MLGVLPYNVLVGLSAQLSDKGIQLIHSDRSLAAVERCLGRVEVGKQTAGDPPVVDMPVIGRMLDARSEGRNGWCVRTIIHLLCARRHCGGQAKHKKCQRHK